MSKNDYDFPVKLERFSAGYKILREDTNQTISVVTQRYHLIKHEEAIQTLRTALKNTNTGVQMTNQYMFGKYHTSLYMEYSSKETIKFGQDVMKLVYFVKNSYDGLSRFSIGISLCRLVCSNGLFIPEENSVLRLKHLGEGTFEKIEEHILNAGNIANKAFETFRLIKKQKPLLEKILVTKTEYKEMLELELFVKYYKELGNNGYAQYQAYTDYITHNTTGDKKEYYNKNLLPLMLKEYNDNTQ